MISSDKLKILDGVVTQRLSKRKMLNNCLQWTSISNINIESVLKPLSCSNTTVCTQSENIPEEYYKKFAKDFHKMIITSDEKETNHLPEIEANASISTGTIETFPNNRGKWGPRTSAGVKVKLSSNIDADAVLKNLNFNSKTGKNKKCQLEEPDYDDVDLSTVVRKPPRKKTKFKITNIQNKDDDLNEDLEKRQIDKNKKHEQNVLGEKAKAFSTMSKKKTNWTKTGRSNKADNDDIEDEFVKNLSPYSKNKHPPLDLEFKTAKEELQEQHTSKNTVKYENHGSPLFTKKDAPNSKPLNTMYNNGNKRTVGNKRSASGKFVSPMLSNNSDSKSQEWLDAALSTNSDLKNIEPRMVELIRSEIMDRGPSIDWADIAGLEFAKQAVQEAIVWPMLRPDIFKGLRRPPKGILFFGPPGTGKTLIGKCVASQSKSTFFSISASTLTSKWVGEGEKMVRALFTVARSYQPAVIFIDEVDSLLSQRSESEHESSRRIKTEFLVQLDGASTDADERVLVVGATNRPQELDEAARRRFTKRLYIPLPEKEARLQIVQRLMTNEKNSLNELELDKISELSDGFSGADMRNLCAEACLGPIRNIDMSKMASIQAAEVPAVQMEDFQKSFARVRPSVCQKDLEQYIQWDSKYGSGL